MYTPNKEIACEPFQSRSIEKKGADTGFVTIGQGDSMTALRVVFRSATYLPGSTVWVRSDRCQQGWAKKIYDIDGRRFIMVPEGEVAVDSRYLEKPCDATYKLVLTDGGDIEVPCVEYFNHVGMHRSAAGLVF